MHDGPANETTRDTLTVHTMALAELRSRSREAHRLIDQARAIARASFDRGELRYAVSDFDSIDAAEIAARNAGALVDAAHRLLPGLAETLEDDDVATRDSEAEEEARLGRDASHGLEAMVAVLHSDVADEEDVHRVLAEAGVDVEALLDAIERAELIAACALLFRGLTDAMSDGQAPSSRRLGVHAGMQT